MSVYYSYDGLYQLLADNAHLKTQPSGAEFYEMVAFVYGYASYCTEVTRSKSTQSASGGNAYFVPSPPPGPDTIHNSFLNAPYLITGRSLPEFTLLLMPTMSPIYFNQAGPVTRLSFLYKNCEKYFRDRLVKIKCCFFWPDLYAGPTNMQCDH